MAIPKLKLLSSVDSAILAGVNVDTIRQYKDLGLLRVQTLDGTDYFEEEDIKLIFNSRRKEIKLPNLVTEDAIKGAQELPTLTSILKEESALPVSENKEPVKESKVVRIHAEKEEVKPEQKVKVEIGEKYSPDLLEGELEKSKIENASNPSYHEFGGPSSIEILELSRSLKQQLELVMSERDWLRQRVEKLDLQLERQQMISMSETETLRLLAKGKEASPSPWAFLLSWAQPKNK